MSALDMATTSDTSAITCTACRQSLIGAESRREHYRSDFHRVNLKRKIAGLGCLTSAEFEHRLQALEEQKTDTSDKTRRARRERNVNSSLHYCETCSKKFSSERALQNHQASKRHQHRLLTIQRQMKNVKDQDEHSISVMGDSDDDDMLSTDSDVSDSNEVEMELKQRLDAWASTGGVANAGRTCAFDGSIHENAETTLEYMRYEYGFFVAYKERLKDAPGLVQYCAEKVAVGYACLACDRAFVNVDAARTHMIDVGHCQMTLNEDGWMEEFGEYYNWGDIEDDEEWEEVSPEEQEMIEKQGMMMVITGNDDDEKDFRPIGRLDTGENEEGDEAMMVGLAVGGKVVGHRGLQRYYKQGRGPQKDERAAVVANKRYHDGRMMIGLKNRLEEEKVMPLREKRWQSKQRKRFALMVGGQNYYTRKARFKQAMAVFNSGYRA